MASGSYESAWTSIMSDVINLSTDAIKMMLVTASYAPNPDHVFVSDLGGVEISGPGYVGGFGGVGRKTLTGKTFTTDPTNNRAKFSAGSVTWSAINAGSPRYAILIKEGTSDADSRLLAYLDLGTVVTNGGDLTVTPDAVLGLILATMV